MRRLLTAQRAWLLVGAFVVAYETLCPPGELMTTGCDRARARHPVLVTASILYLAGHLTRIVPRRLDPLSIIADHVGELGA